MQRSAERTAVAAAAEPAWRLGHRPSLDGLRAFAVALVVVEHGTDRFQGAGPAGVTLFFALSGLLITALLRSEVRLTGRVDYRSFFARRALRLLPALVVMVTVVTVVPAFAVRGATGLVALTYLSNFLVAGGTKLAALQHTWSLAVEEHFYLAWPFVVAACRRARGCLLVALVLAGAVLAWRAHLLEAGVPAARVMFATDARIDAVLLGCALALALETGRLRSAPRWLLAPGLAALLAVSVLPTHDFARWGQPLATAASLCVVWSLATRESRPFASTIAGWVGRRAYAIYLWNLPLAALLLPRLPLPLPASNLVVVVTLVAVAALSYRFVETPFLRRKARLRARA